MAAAIVQVALADTPTVLPAPRQGGYFTPRCPVLPVSLVEFPTEVCDRDTPFIDDQGAP